MPSRADAAALNVHPRQRRDVYEGLAKLPAGHVAASGRRTAARAMTVVAVLAPFAVRVQTVGDAVALRSARASGG